MAQVDFSSVICDLFGRPCIEAPGGDGTPVKQLTLATVASSALTATIPGEPNQTGAVKAQRFSLAMRVVGGGPVDLTDEDVVMLKELIGNVYSPLVVGRSYEILDQPAKE